MPLILPIHSIIHDYEVIFEESAEFLNQLTTMEQSCFVVDENVWQLYADTLLKNLPRENLIIIPINEDFKNLESVQNIYNHLVERPAKRNLTLISIGGGILQDISGFAASTIYRGIRWIFVPTTLLAQADSCIGSKTSLNYRSYKNLIGTFYPPVRIHIYPQFLQSLQDVDFYSGLGEVIKLHLMGGEKLLFSFLELFPNLVQREIKSLQSAVYQSLQVKLNYIAGDEFDNGRRNLLNFGHDFGHALESTSHFEIPHGQAVIVGMIAANIVANQRGLLDGFLEQDILNKLLLPSLTIRPSVDSLDSASMINALKKDKKRTGENLALIMMDTNFELSRVNDLTIPEVESAISKVKIRLGI